MIKDSKGGGEGKDLVSFGNPPPPEGGFLHFRSDVLSRDKSIVVRSKGMEKFDLQVEKQ